jgi:hypothetical protein
MNPAPSSRPSPPVGEKVPGGRLRVEGDFDQFMVRMRVMGIVEHPMFDEKRLRDACPGRQSPVPANAIR